MAKRRLIRAISRSSVSWGNIGHSPRRLASILSRKEHTYDSNSSMSTIIGLKWKAMVR